MMKNKTLLYSIIIYLFSFNNWAQKKADLQNEKKIDGTANILKINNKIYEQNMKVKYYHVEETVPMKFGGYKTVYNVSNPKLIQTYDLGPNGKRVVTAVFSDGQQSEKVTLKSDSVFKIDNAVLSTNVVPKKDNTAHSTNVVPKKDNTAHSTNVAPKKDNTAHSANFVPKKDNTALPTNVVQKKDNTTLPINDFPKKDTAPPAINEAPKKTETNEHIDIIKTYERVSGKGYDSIDILKIVGNYYFFNNELEKAEKCYSKLFSKTSDLEPAYYFHYAITLKAVGKIDRSSEYHKKFYELTRNNTR